MGFIFGLTLWPAKYDPASATFSTSFPTVPQRSRQVCVVSHRAMEIRRHAIRSLAALLWYAVV